MAGPFSTIDVICSRRQALKYVAPGFCEVDFSSTGEPVIVLTPFRRRRGPTGFAATAINGRIRFRWDTSDGAICYSLYRSEGGMYVLVAECIGTCVDGECTFTCDACGPGTYVVTAITAEGETETSEEVTVQGFAPECADVAGQPVPTGPTAFDIDEEIAWEDMAVNQANWTPHPNFPSFSQIQWGATGEYPPGHYDVKYLTGFFDTHDAANPCAPLSVEGTVFYSNTSDDNFNLDNSLFITDHIYEIDPPGSTHVADGTTRCALSYAGVEAAQQSFWNQGTDDGARHRFKHQERHENDGGKLMAVFRNDVLFSYSQDAGFPYRLQLIQTDGLIAQPRNIRVQGWDFIKGTFSPGVQSWDGVFTERVTYESDELIYQAPASGSFGGALAYYVGTGHPTSPNGAGWIVDIYFDATTIEWTGLKTIDEQAIGQYNRAVGSPNVPACCVLEAVPDEP